MDYIQNSININSLRVLHSFVAVPRSALFWTKTPELYLYLYPPNWKSLEDTALNTPMTSESTLNYLPSTSGPVVRFGSGTLQLLVLLPSDGAVSWDCQSHHKCGLLLLSNHHYFCSSGT